MFKLFLISLISFAVFAEATPVPSPTETKEQKAATEDAKSADSCSSDSTSCGCKH